MEGEECRPCQCSGNINMTDPEACSLSSGECLKCLNHTMGPGCAYCQDWYHGDAINLKNCQGIDINSVWKYSLMWFLYCMFDVWKFLCGYEWNFFSCFQHVLVISVVLCHVTVNQEPVNVSRMWRDPTVTGARSVKHDQLFLMWYSFLVQNHGDTRVQVWTSIFLIQSDA